MKELKQYSKASNKGILTHVNDGVTLYRHIGPINAMKKLGWEFEMNDFDFGVTKLSQQEDKEFHSVMKAGAQIITTQRNDIPHYIAMGSLLQAGYKIPWVYDTDDDVHSVRPTNPGFYSYNMNSPHIGLAIKALESAFAVTVSTDTLKEIYKENNARIYVLPNALDFSRWDKHPRGRKPKKEIRIGLLVSAAHYENIKIIEDVVIEILKAYEHAHFYVTGMFKNEFLVKVPKEIKKRIHLVEWMTGDMWPKNCKKLSLDMGLAPLVDNDFNRAKSNLRWLEYTGQHIPTIASDVLPYRTADEGAILLAKTKKDWFEHISNLIENPKLRTKIATAAVKQVKREYDINIVAKEYDRVYKEIIKDFKELYGEPHRSDNYSGVNNTAIEDAIKSVSESIIKDNRRKR